MPTGYTAELVEKGQDFRSFVLRCARGMGACIMQRDDSLDQPPAKQKPSDYHSKALKEAEKALAKLKAMSPAKARAFGEAKKAKELARLKQSQAKVLEEESRLVKMAAQVKAWIPPTKDHQGLKDFMLQQIEVSSSGDYMAKYVKEAEEKTPEVYFSEELSKAARDIRYHTEEHAKEIERTNERNKWIEQLYQALPSR